MVPPLLLDAPLVLLTPSAPVLVFKTGARAGISSSESLLSDIYISGRDAVLLGALLVFILMGVNPEVGAAKEALVAFF